MPVNGLGPNERTRTVLSTVTYLEMRSPPAPGGVRLPAASARVERIVAPSVGEYRSLYRRVGSQYHWLDRIVMPDDELRAILEDDAVEVYLLQVDDQPAGFCELDRRVDGQIELVQFGLFPEFVGRGLGPMFLAWALRRAWSYGPQRVWLHTCDLDHPAALPVYRKAGFEIYDEKVVEQLVLDERPS